VHGGSCDDHVVRHFLLRNSCLDSAYFMVEIKILSVARVA
jgi:hypothetical protein